MTRLNLVFLIAFVGLLVWITLFQPDTVRTIQRGAMVALRPFMKGAEHIEEAVASIGEESLTPTQLRERLTEAERERDRLKLEVIQLDDLLEENNQLRRALQYQEKSPLRLVAARLLSRKPSQWYNTIVIDKGARSGVVVDAPVIVPLGEEAGLVGKVTEVIGPDSAVVLLLTDEMCQVSARLENSQDQGILSGQRGLLRSQPSLKLRYLSKEVVAKPGTKVFSSGVGELFPANLYLGEIMTLEIGAIDAEAIVRPAVDFDHFDDFFVILPVPNEAVATPEAGATPDTPVP